MRALPPIIGGNGSRVRSRAGAAGAASRLAGPWGSGLCIGNDPAASGGVAAVAGIAVGARVTTGRGVAAGAARSADTPDVVIWPSVVCPGKIVALRGPGRIGH